MNILVLCGAGIGGTEKAAFLFAAALLQRGHFVAIMSDPDQPRVAAFEASGGTMIGGDCRKKNILRAITDHDIELIHQHVSGYGDHRELYMALDELGDSRPKLIETNVFGQLLDYYDNGHVDCRMFITFTSGMQAFMRTRVRNSNLNAMKHNVLFYPMPGTDFFSNAETRRMDFRRSIDVLENEFLVIRVGRPGHKWTDWECKAFARARAKNPLLKMYLIEPNAPIVRDIERGRYGDGIIVGKATSDSRFLADMYLSADLMLHASDFGESFGYTVAEAMQAAIPVITLATSWGDNAQTELVAHGLTGYVCGSVRGMAEALAELSRDPEKCNKMGEAGAQRISEISSIEKETDLLEDIIFSISGKSDGTLAKARYEAWTDFIRAQSSGKHACYEADTGDGLAEFQALIYRKLRELKSLKRYFKLKYKGRDVVFPRKPSALLGRADSSS